MTAAPLFADVEQLVVLLLADALDCRVSTELPAHIETVLPVVRVSRTGGPDDKITDSARIDVETFHSDRGRSWDLAQQAREAMHAAAHTVVGGRLIDTVDTETAPMWIDYANDSVRRYTATYRVTSRIRAAS